MRLVSIALCLAGPGRAPTTAGRAASSGFRTRRAGDGLEAPAMRAERIDGAAIGVVAQARRAADTMSHSHAAIIAAPPIGVTAPNIVTPVSASA